MAPGNVGDGNTNGHNNMSRIAYSSEESIWFECTKPNAISHDEKHDLTSFKEINQEDEKKPSHFVSVSSRWAVIESFEWRSTNA